MSQLVQKLSAEDHFVQLCKRQPQTAEAFRQSIDRGYVHILFPNTQGGTELGLRLEKDSVDLSGADFAEKSGKVRFIGRLVLDYVKVRCVVEIDLATLTGRAHLEPIEG